MAARSLIENPDEIRRVLAGNASAARARADAVTSFRASAELVRNLTVETRAGGHTIVVDEPSSFAGAGLGPNPLETLLAGVGSCLAITIAVNAAQLGVGVRSLRVDVSADADLAAFYGLAAGPLGFERLTCDVALDTDADEATARELARLAEERCPGLGAIRLAAPVETRWRHGPG
ncbi:MAG: OsmC family protein [Thermoleophilia bacterium]|nr:OsmC family protein [Thermoleophilia bacterium]